MNTRTLPPCISVGRGWWWLEKSKQSGHDLLATGLQLRRCATLGPKGRNVIIEQAYSGPKITKDGVTVAKSITLKDKFENLGARLIQDVASKTNEITGDGTTTTTVLVCAIYSEGIKNVAAGCNPMDLRCGSQAAVDRVVSFLSAHAKTITPLFPQTVTPTLEG
uniref:Heat shock protein 60 n=1 Tax=Psilocybe cubensis TaxID=181762 RepID=A0A8H7XI17_PSICU